jgi:hypothetical protein
LEQVMCSAYLDRYSAGRVNRSHAKYAPNYSPLTAMAQVTTVQLAVCKTAALCSGN